ncbi:hypothetical protein ETB97_012571 [Aspergillus alliaceus]|uniref:ABC transporter domain-containing protein n=1 Tax=Petromyces alliaceus TaxID=209559 RepID=A0A8H6A8I3_PETAA|nr:hypothetical protein ETB97_012571 [Aspergillus burnettii]
MVSDKRSSGESSLILNHRLNKIQHEAILIDNEDISKMPRETIRSRLATLPQDPMLLNGSIRSNIDPLIWQVMSLLSQFLPRLSSGKQQLRPVARVLLDQSQILVLDEATPLVDHATERNITDLVREKFQDRTVVAVAHRLRMIRHFDVVVVMEEGKIIKTGLPTQLLQDPGSRFRDKWLKEGGDPV